MKRVLLIVSICCAVSATFVGVLRYLKWEHSCNYSIGVPIGNCTRISYDNYHLIDNGVNIYAPCGSFVEAAMSGVVIAIQNIDSSYTQVSTINLENALISRYCLVDSIRVQVGDYVNMYDTLGVIGTRHNFLHYELLRIHDGKEEYLNPLKKFNECFE